MNRAGLIEVILFQCHAHRTANFHDLLEPLPSSGWGGTSMFIRSAGRVPTTGQRGVFVRPHATRPPVFTSREPGEWPHGWQYWVSSIQQLQVGCIPIIHDAMREPPSPMPQRPRNHQVNVRKVMYRRPCVKTPIRATPTFMSRRNVSKRTRALCDTNPTHVLFAWHPSHVASVCDCQSVEGRKKEKMWRERAKKPRNFGRFGRGLFLGSHPTGPQVRCSF